LPVSTTESIFLSFGRDCGKDNLFDVTYMSLLWLLVVFLNTHVMSLKHFKCLVRIYLTLMTTSTNITSGFPTFSARQQHFTSFRYIILGTKAVI